MKVMFSYSHKVINGYNIYLMVKKTKREKRTQINNINNRYSPINIEQLKIEAGENF